MTTIQELISNSRTKGLSAGTISHLYPWLQSGRQCKTVCTDDKGQLVRCKEPVYGDKKHCYYHRKRENGLIGLPPLYGSDYHRDYLPAVSKAFRRDMSEKIGAEVEIFEVA